MHDEFIAAIHGRRMLRVTFTATGDGAVRTRRCAPMDFGPSRRSTDRRDRYHFWDYDSPDGSHTLSLFPEQIGMMEVMPDEFDPADFVTWNPDWFVPRDWGSFS